MGHKLKKNPIGKTNIYLSEIGLGTVKFGRNTDIKYPKSFEIPDDKRMLDILKTIGGLGVNYLDTAIAYGNANERLGNLLPMIDYNFKIIAKVGERYCPIEGSKYDFSKKALNEDFNKLKLDLNINFIECLLLHCNNSDYGKDIENGYKVIKEMKNLNYIGAFGSSCKTRQGVNLALEMNCDVIMIEPDLFQETQQLFKKNPATAIIVKKVFSSGNILLDNTVSPSDILDSYIQDKAILSAVIGSINVNHITQNIIPLIR